MYNVLCIYNLRIKLQLSLPPVYITKSILWLFIKSLNKQYQSRQNTINTRTIKIFQISNCF